MINPPTSNQTEAHEFVPLGNASPSYCLAEVVHNGMRSQCGQPRDAAIHRPSTEKRGCRECAGVTWHKGDCSLNVQKIKQQQAYSGIFCVLDSERVASGEEADDVGIAIVEVDGVVREAVPCPDGIEGCEVLHLRPLAASPAPPAPRPCKFESCPYDYLPKPHSINDHPMYEPASEAQATGDAPPARIWIDNINSGDVERYIYTAPCPPELAGKIHVTEYMLKADHEKEVAELRRQDAQSRQTGCWCDEYGHPCKACEDKQQLAAEVAALREALRGLGRDKQNVGTGMRRLCWCSNINVCVNEPECAAARNALNSAGEE